MCVFCAIVRGEAEASVVHDDADVIAFMDIRPVTPGHLLVIPKRHATGLADLAEHDGQRMWSVAHRMATALRHTELRCEGVNLFLADGAAAGQEVFHVHLHVFPRYRHDGFRLGAEWRTPPRTELDRTAHSLRVALAGPLTPE